MKISANNFNRISLLVAFFMAISCINALANPCCIIVVPPNPPPPPPRQSQLPPIFYGSVYASLPIESAIHFRSFDPSLKVELMRRSFADAVAMVVGTQGALGVAQIDTLASYKDKTRAEVETAAVLVNRPYFSIFTTASGPKTISQLKGQRIAISGGLDQLFAAEALRSNGINPKEVSFVPVPLAQRFSALGKTVDAVTLPLGYESPQLLKSTNIDFPKSITLPAWVLYASKQTLDKESDEVRRLIDGLTRATKILKSEPDGSRPILAQNFKIVDKTSQDQIVRNLRIVLADTLTPNPREISNTIDTMRSLNLIETDVQLIDPRRLGK